MTYLVVLGVLVALALLGYWWYRRRQQTPPARMVSLVALLAEPITLDPFVLARTAGRAWQADLGDGSEEGEDGFVVCGGPINIIACRGQHYLMNAIPTPYADNPEKAAESILDLRTRDLFARHTAWFSCDAIGLDDQPDEDVAEAYRQLARLLVEFHDENWLLIYCPDTGRTYPINDDTEAALLADNPFAALDETLPAIMISIEEDDPLMLQAVAEARATWSQFLAAFEARAGEDFSVKAPVAYEDHREFIWLEVTAIEGDRIYGTLANDPASLGPLKLGSKVTVDLAELNDWCYLDAEHNPHGMYTLAAMQAAAERQQQQ